MNIRLHNSLHRKVETFKPIEAGKLSLYTCGPTVYQYAHIGNLRTYIFEDLLRRMFEYAGYQVHHVMNITDVGHLTDDADTGEDKMELSAMRQGKTAWDIATFYTKAFLDDIKKLNIEQAHTICKATDHIKEQIEMILAIEKNGYTYQLEDGIYFDTSELEGYGSMSTLDIEGMEAGKRVAMVEGKRNKTDFALWKFSTEAQHRQMEWDSPWGRGFPGWHIECSAMASKYLGKRFDMHTGGVDHLNIHHPNEIAQAQAAFGKTEWVNFWLHGEFLVLEQDRRMGKSEGNFITLSSLEHDGFEPLAYRYMCLTAHYRKQLTFSNQALTSAQNSYRRLKEIILGFKNHAPTHHKMPNQESIHLFKEALADDLNIPQALSVFWGMLRDDTLSAQDRYVLACDMDRVLGLDIANFVPLDIEPDGELKTLLQQREAARAAKDFAASDQIRKLFQEKGFQVLDTPSGQKLRKI